MKHQKSITANLGGTNLSGPLQDIFNRLPVVKGYARHVSITLNAAELLFTELLQATQFRQIQGPIHSERLH